MTRCALSLLVIPLLVVVVDCSPRPQDYGWDEAPRADAGGLEIVVREVSKIGGQVQATLYVRNLTAKNCLFQPLQASDGSSWATASWGQERSAGTVRIVAVATPQHGQAFLRTTDPLPEPFRVQAHSSRIIRADFERSAFSDGTDAWTMHVAGRWSEGGAISLDIAVPALTTRYPYPDGVPVYVCE